VSVQLEDLQQHWRRLVPGAALATAATGVVFGVFSDWPVLFKAYVAGGAYLACAVGSYVWLWRTGDDADYMLSPEELNCARLETHPEEQLAWVGNDKVARFFGRRRIITFEEYRKWRQKNPMVFSCFVAPGRKLLGLFDVFPLTDAAGVALRKGDIGEQDLTLDDILPDTARNDANYVYVATIYSTYRNRHLRARLEQIAAELILRTYPPRKGRYYIAIPYTKEGENLVKRNQFVLETNRRINAARNDIYVLDAEGAARAGERVLQKPIRLRRTVRASATVRTRRAKVTQTQEKQTPRVRSKGKPVSGYNHGA
jgi:hypothetical protein